MILASRLARHTLTALALLWGGAVNVFLVANGLALDAEPVAMINQLAHGALLLHLPIFALAWTMRGSLRLVAWLLPGVLAFCVWYGSAWLPKSAPEPRGITFTVVTHNIQGFGADPQIAVTLIRAMDADIVALQEARGTQEIAFQRQLTDMYPHQVFYVATGNGLALLSRYPIRAVQRVPVAGDVPRHLRVEIEINGRRVAIFVIHPPTPTWAQGVDTLAEMLRAYDETEHRRQVDFAIEQLRAESLPVLLFCDCNATPRSYTYRQLNRVLDDAFGAQGWGLGLTHPVGTLPLLRIDYVWHSAEFTAIDAKVWRDAGTSDHYPVWAKLALVE
jgi:endonuclease/exonuclease/phosphatase family metal-dependent hydrolase